MFTIYYSNLLETQKDILIHLMDIDPLRDPLAEEIILVQSPGMAQWLQWQIAEKKGIASNLRFPMPASFIWQQYTQNLSHVEQDNAFNKAYMTWRLMGLIPTYLEEPAFEPLRLYLQQSGKSEQQKRYQLASKIADLFDQYLVYRSDWIKLWEEGQDEQVLHQFNSERIQSNNKLLEQIQQHSHWQGILWRALVENTKQDNPLACHRADLQQQYLNLLATTLPQHLPKRIFVFGISALPQNYLTILQGISEYCDVHLFFTNGCREYWGDIVDEKLSLGRRLVYQIQQAEQRIHMKNWFSPEQREALQQQQLEKTYDDEMLQVGNPLLASWGKLGRDFLYLLTDLGAQEIEAYVGPDINEISEQSSLLTQVKQYILNFTPNSETLLHQNKNDNSISVHSCYSPMREVENLQDYLLNLFNQQSDLTPKDVVVMVADIDQYTPYIQAVFGQGKPYIPFSIADNKLTESDILVSSFLQLLNLKESQFSAEEVLAFLDIPAIHQRFGISVEDLKQIHYWTGEAGVRFGLAKEHKDKNNSQQAFKNYNAWQAGLERMLLGFAMREENGIWQDSLGLDESEGLAGQLVGNLAEFIHTLWQWQQTLTVGHNITQWKNILLSVINDFFISNEQTQNTLFYLQDQVQELSDKIENVHFSESLNAEVIAQAMDGLLQDNPNSVKFLVGKVNFCTLLPMRSIPFKVVCLLGMNDGDYPRQQSTNSFDLVQYAPRKGDRFRRDDDRYLFLEALLSAQEHFYISYVGRSIIDDAEKEPSVLVNQLLDYLADNLVKKTDELNNALALDQQKKEIRQGLIHQHSMTPFGIQNFSQAPYSFSQKWFAFAQREEQQQNNFILNKRTETFEQLDLYSEISVEQLIVFIQHPVKYFFERRLGVYFRDEMESIAENENFELNTLDSYQLNNQFIYFDKEQREEQWLKWQIKGLLPRGKFAEIIKLRTFDEIDSFKVHIEPYLSIAPQSKRIDNLTLKEIENLPIQGYLNQLYDNELVTWRLASLKDKDIIQLWLKYLILVVISPEGEQDSDTPINLPVAKHFAKDKWIQFKGLSKQSAIDQLSIYLKAYAQGEKQLFLIPSEHLRQYWKVCVPSAKKGQDEAPAVDITQCYTALCKLMTEDDQYKHTYADAYWCRVMAQQNLAEQQMKDINYQTKNWFSLMLNSLEEMKY